MEEVARELAGSHRISSSVQMVGEDALNARQAEVSVRLNASDPKYQNTIYQQAKRQIALSELLAEKGQEVKPKIQTASSRKQAKVRQKVSTLLQKEQTQVINHQTIRLDDQRIKKVRFRKVMREAAKSPELLRQWNTQWYCISSCRSTKNGKIPARRNRMHTIEIQKNLR